mmetsp:Transcript_5701/g.12358  ORF Transcript_5701/g.12358 Transcript_5701/m.12358 type:complete len:558 (-) Transcript_5701:79-1752(-)
MSATATIQSSNVATTTAKTATTNVVTSINMADPTTILSSTTPNSKPRQPQTKKVQTYVYQDLANAEPSNLKTGSCHERVPPRNLQSQKLPSKLASMLSDPDLTSAITWMPHGRSWKILNRELFSSFAMPRYFGHSNHASFVRIVNAWGFRRVTKGTDRDSYYHELFLRGKPRLHERMKRLPTCHRKTPVDKDDKCPDFYELAKTSPLPAAPLSIQGVSTGGGGSEGESVAARTSTINQITAASGYLGNPMAATATSHSLGLGNHTTNSLFGDLNGSGPSLSSAMGSYLSSTTNANKQGNDIPSLLKMLRQQGTLQQHQEVQQGSNSANNVMSQNLMHQLLRMQHTHPSHQTQSQVSSLLDTGIANNNLGQLANVANTFAQPPSTTSLGNDTLFNSLSSSPMNSILPNRPQRLLSNDKISVNDVIQLRSIERTNELLAQKLASMQQDTMIMKQNQNPTDGNPANAADQSSINKQCTLPTIGVTETPAAAHSKGEMLLQMIRRENQMKGGLMNRQQAVAPSNNMSSHVKLEEGNSGMSQGLNHLLQSLTGMQQQRTNAL